MPDGYQPEDGRPHVDAFICGQCRRPITKGHRVLQTWIAEGKSVNPRNIGETGLFMTGEFEFVHVDCHDPYLKHGMRK